MQKTFFALIFLALLGVGIASAAWPLGKSATCEFLNASSLSHCDELWCGVIDCSYDANRSACICGDSGIIGKVNFSDYYNKSEVEMLLSNYSQNTSGAYIDNETFFSTIKNLNFQIDELDNKTFDIARRQSSVSNSSSGSDMPWYAWVIIAVLACGTLVYLAMASLNRKQYPKAVPATRQPFKSQGPSLPQHQPLRDFEEIKRNVEGED